MQMGKCCSCGNFNVNRAVICWRKMLRSGQPNTQFIAVSFQPSVISLGTRMLA